MPQYFSVGIDNNPVKSMVTGSINGAINGFIYSGMTGGNIKDGVTNGAKNGAIIGFITSQNFVNFMEGEGFRNDEAVFNKYKNSGETGWQSAYTKFNNRKYGINTVYKSNRDDSEALSDRIELGKYAFDSYGEYITTLDHEIFHINNPHEQSHLWSGNRNHQCFDCESNASGFVLSSQGLYYGIGKDGINNQSTYYKMYSGYGFKSHWVNSIPLRIYVRLLW